MAAVVVVALVSAGSVPLLALALTVVDWAAEAEAEAEALRSMVLGHAASGGWRAGQGQRTPLLGVDIGEVPLAVRECTHCCAVVLEALRHFVLQAFWREEGPLLVVVQVLLQKGSCV